MKYYILLKLSIIEILIKNLLKNYKDKGINYDYILRLLDKLKEIKKEKKEEKKMTEKIFFIVLKILFLIIEQLKKRDPKNELVQEIGKKVDDIRLITEVIKVADNK